MKNDSHFEIRVYQGETGMSLIHTIDEWVNYHAKKFPFLYANQGEIIPHYIFFEDPQGFVLFAEKANKQVALLAAIPMDSPHMDAANYNPFSEMSSYTDLGFNPEKIMYAAVFFIADEERGNRRLILEMYQQAAKLAIERGKKQFCYFTTVREDNHPLKPLNYVPPEPWEELPIPVHSMGIHVNFTWPTFQADGSVKDQLNTQALYFLDI